jgi:hypothetical protein
VSRGVVRHENNVLCTLTCTFEQVPQALHRPQDGGRQLLLLEREAEVPARETDPIKTSARSEIPLP